ncbi:MAG: flagellar biosynthesis anti-sigma factor FlgM [Nitrococcus sp.]|nr:flagellar biosynthesis anti-sigma factor FlgM [Nitrococcus sp.]
MTNPIDNRPRVTPPQVSGTDHRPRAETGSAGATAKAPSSPRLDSSLQLNHVQAAHEAFEHTPEIDSKRVADIRARIARGDYPLNVERIAERFAAFEKLLDG